MNPEVTDPIREDASAAEEATRVAQTSSTNDVPDPRDEAIARIEQSNLELMAQQEAVHNGQTEGQAPTPEEGRRGSSEVSLEETATGMVKIMVDGEEKVVPLAEVVKGYQKDTTASQRLREAAERLKEAERRETEIAEREEQLRLQATEHGEAGATETDDETELAAAGDAFIEHGDIKPLFEVAKKAVMKELAAAGHTPGSVDPQELSRMVSEQLAQEKINLEHKTATEAFKRDYKEIFEDPVLLGMANRNYFAKVDQGMSISEAMAEAGRETKEWIATKAGVSVTDPLREKLERKQSLDTITPATGRTSGGATGEDYSPQATIAEMKKERGQA